ncbi:hypothetical protein [Streptomyces sp. MH60]|uniref:hypothetical protein n=1 Tax=Streptomyces sp. MH60 TaxID=1940758 RepID=UPI000CEE60A3|nr:hypothetical protein [Streptomyces sp. MH60]PPS89573.1 hypothetical protein BZZ08_01720 [Streptomyces sp. MH60]
MSNPKAKEAAAVALEAIRDAHPALLTLTQAAERVASHADVTTGTTRKWLRAAVEEGDILELTPWSRKFIIKLPGTEAAGLGPFYIAQEWTGTGREHRKVITTDDSKMRPSSYGPGNTTYVTDPEQIREYVQQLVDEKKAKEEAERQARQDEKKIERQEISRRFPGLQRSLRTLRMLSTDVREHQDRFASMGTSVYLEDPERHKEKVAAEERDVSVTIHAWGDENVAVLQSILTAGISALLAEQPVTHCKHCSGRILLSNGPIGKGWWHVDTVIASCGKDTDTKAEPAEEVS